MMSSNIVKGGALLDDSRMFVELWDDESAATDNMARVTEENALGLPTASRASDVAMYVLRPRFVDPGDGVIEALRLLRNDPPGFTDACYFEATRADELLGHFAEQAVPAWHESGRLTATVDDAENWLEGLAGSGSIPEWSESLRHRVASGLLATMRDFGRFTGPRKSPNKELAPPGISFPGFAYVAYRLHQTTPSARAVVTSPVWRRWLLDDLRVDELFHRAAAHGICYFHTAGSAMRLDWRVGSLPEVVRAAA